MEYSAIVTFLLTVFGGVLLWILKTIFERMEKIEYRFLEIEKDMAKMKTNYMARFEEAREHRYNMHTELTAILNSIDKKIDVYIAKN